MGIKHDMGKAYDPVEWVFLEFVMGRLGFSNQWITWIMAYVRSVSYSVLVNGCPVGEIIPTRGIRQGDPISPYLFLICAETLSSLLLQAEHNGVIFGVPTSNRGPKLNHLFFTDDSLIFCNANPMEWRKILQILSIYEAGLGSETQSSKDFHFL